MEKNRAIEDLLEDEWYHVRYSGEIPEVALHSSLHFLSEDREGPGIQLDGDAIDYLNQAVISRYREIILRDITPENKEKSIYRGVLRAIANWRRLKRFCHRHGLNQSDTKEEIACQLRIFLENEIALADDDNYSAGLNCSFVELESFAVELNLSLTAWRDTLEPRCQNI